MIMYMYLEGVLSKTYENRMCAIGLYKCITEDDK